LLWFLKGGFGLLSDTERGRGDEGGLRETGRMGKKKPQEMGKTIIHCRKYPQPYAGAETRNISEGAGARSCIRGQLSVRRDRKKREKGGKARELASKWRWN